MSIYKSVEHITEVLEDVFDQIFNDPKTGPKFQKTGLLLRYTVKDPDGIVWIDALNKKIGSGEPGRDASIELELDGDTIHDFFLKKVNVNVALATRKIKARGAITKFLKVMPVLKKAYVLYPDIAKAKGLM